MIRTHTHVLREHLKQLADARSRADDADALNRHRAGDPDAFADLVHRHGPMVYGVCRRVLGPTPDADDAFQAVFLALVRKPSAVRKVSALPAWLHRVALRTARKALARRKPVHPADETAASRHAGPADLAAWADVRRALDDELNRLPDSYRAPLVLCYLDGATRDEAARRLGWTVATLDRRLAAGRARLRDRLARRGLGAAALGTAVFADGLRAAVPDHLARAATALAPACVSAPAAVRALAVGRGVALVPITATVLVLGALAMTLVGAAGRPAGDEPAPQPPGPADAKAPAPEPAEPLPDGAVARMGSTRLRHVGVSGFAFLPDGKTVRTVGADRVVRAWDTTTGRQTGSVVLRKGTAGAVALSADGKTAAACNKDAITVWDAESGEVLATLTGPKADLGSFGFSPDGKMLCAATWDIRLTVWDWRAGKQEAVPVPKRDFGMDSTFHGHFSPDGKHFAGGGGSGQPLCLFETATWREVHRFNCHAATSTFTPDGKRLVVCSMKDDAGAQVATIRVFDVTTGKELSQASLGHEFACFALAVSPDGRVLGCGASDRSCLLDLTTGRVLHRLTGRPWAVGFAPDGKTFAATAAGTHLRLWDVEAGRERHEQPGNFGSAVVSAVSPDGGLVAAADWIDSAVHVWDTATGRRVGLFPLKGEGRYTLDLSFSPDGRTLSAGLYQGTVQVWDVATGKEMRAGQIGGKPGPGNRSPAHFYSARVLPDGRRVAAVDHGTGQRGETRLVVWDVASGKPVKQWEFPGERRGRAWSPDGETVALVLGQRIALIDLETGDERAQLDGVARDSAPPTMSPDGRLIAARRTWEKGTTPTVGVYEVATGKSVAALPVGWGEFALAGDNRTLFTADNTHLRAWDLPTGKEVARRPLSETLGEPRVRIGITRLVPLGGRRVFTPLVDGTGLVWDLVSPVAQANAIDEKQLAAAWVDLRADDPTMAYAAVWRLADASPGAVVAYIGRHLRPEALPDPAKLRQLIADLNSDTFRVREKAGKELQDLGHAAAPALRRALADGPSPEAARRIQQLLGRKPDAGPRPDQLRRLRALQVLERIGSPDARRLLADLAGGLPLAPESKAAQAAFARGQGSPSR
jgi:RNA polymerase sigma factor (sigma-70 family)